MKTNQLQKLIDGCLKNKRSSQAKLYDFCFDSMMRVAMRYHNNRDDASSTVNQSFFKTLKSLSDYDRTKNFNTWLCTIVIRTAIDELRKIKSERKNVEYVDQYDHLAVDYSADYDELIEQLSQAELDEILNSLDEHEKMTFNLFEYDDYSHKEIAELLDCSERTSKRYLNRAKAKLKESLELKLKQKNAV